MRLSERYDGDIPYKWVRYECGCREGLWVSPNAKCCFHDTSVSEASVNGGLSPPDVFEIRIKNADSKMETTEVAISKMEQTTKKEASHGRLAS